MPKDKELDKILDEHLKAAWLQKLHTTTKVPAYELSIEEAKAAILKKYISRAEVLEMIDYIIGEDVAPDIERYRRTVDGKREYYPDYSLKAILINKEKAEQRERANRLRQKLGADHD